MKSKKKFHLLTNYLQITNTFFFAFILVIFLFGIICTAVFPDERDNFTTDCQLFKADWEQILPDGTRVPVTVPGKITARRGEEITISTTLPKIIYNGENLCFRPIWQDVSVYIDGELRQNHNTADSRPFGINSPMRYIFVELYETDAEKELTYQFSSQSKYAGDIRDIYIGDRASIWIYLLKSSGIRTAIAIFNLLLSIFCIIVCFVLKFLYKKELPLHHLAWTIFFCALWMLAEIEFRQVFVKNVSVLSYYSYWSLMLIPFPLIIYINQIQNYRYKKIFLVPITYSSIMLLLGTTLQIFDIVQFVQQVPFIHVGIIIAMTVIVATITLDAITKKLSDYLSVSIGIYGLLFTTVLEMVLYYTGSSLSLGTVLACGLFFLLIMAIIKTGQDIFLLEKKKQQAITAKEAQAKFLANMSHEIRTPINAIIGMNEMILRENNNAAIQDYAYNIQSASNMLLGLVNDVLDFSKIESGQLELVSSPYYLATLLQDEILLLKARTNGKTISTKLDIAPELPCKLLGDELRIKQILTNLLSNAVKYTNEGSICLKVFFQNMTSDSVELCFSVSDSGIGIKKEDLPKLFDSFKRLELDKNRAIQGTGLGLNIAKQLTESMQGTIQVESEYGKGSTFTISIPQKIVDTQPMGNLEEALANIRKQKPAPQTLFTAPNVSILIVDDNSTNLILMKGLLKRTKANVTLATSGQKCLELTKTNHYDIIFMDHMMPELDGVETLRLLRSDASNPNQNTIVIALTANAIAGCREMYADYGFDDYFSKPVQADKLDVLLLHHLPKELVQIVGETS